MTITERIEYFWAISYNALIICIWGFLQVVLAKLWATLLQSPCLCTLEHY